MIPDSDPPPPALNELQTFQKALRLDSFAACYVRIAVHRSQHSVEVVNEFRQSFAVIEMIVIVDDEIRLDTPIQVVIGTVLQE